MTAAHAFWSTITGRWKQRSRRTHYIITYDDVNDSHRTRLSKLLEGYGDRVQYSVFEADLSRVETQAILTLAAKLISEADSLRLYPMCEECTRGVKTIGRKYEPPPEVHFV